MFSGGVKETIKKKWVNKFIGQKKYESYDWIFIKKQDF